MHGSFDDLPDTLDDGVEPATVAPRERLATAADLLAYALAGRAVLTLESARTGARYTYRVARPAEPGRGGVTHFVGVLTGPENSTDYAYLGLVRSGPAGARYERGAKSRVGADAPLARAFEWAFRAASRGVMPRELRAWHSGRCGRCARLLTVPESVARGIGSECAAKMGF